MNTQQNIIHNRLAYKSPPDNWSWRHEKPQRMLRNSASFIGGVLLVVGIAWVFNDSYQNELRIESEKAQMCAKTPGIADCRELPKTSHWRN